MEKVGNENPEILESTHPIDFPYRSLEALGSVLVNAAELVGLFQPNIVRIENIYLEKIS